MVFTQDTHLLLLRRTQLQPDESLASLLFRLAKLNYYTSPKTIELGRQWWGQSPDNPLSPVRPESYQVLAEITGLTIDELYAATPHRFAPILNPLDSPGETIELRPNHRVPLLSCARGHIAPPAATSIQFCPLCLGETVVYHRLGWLLRIVSVCTKHKCLLTNECPACGKKLRINNLSAGRQCLHCSFDLSKAPVTNLTDDEFGLFSQTVIQSWFGLISPPENAPLPGQPPAALYNFIYEIRRVLPKVKDTWPQFHRLAGLSSISPGEPGYDCARSYLLYTTAFKALCNWPQGLYDFLDDYKQYHVPESAGSPAADLRPLYTPWNSEQWQQPELQFAQDAFDDYLVSRYWLTPAVANLQRVKRNPDLAVRFEYITAAQAGQRLGVTSWVVKRLAALGFLDGRQVERGDSPWRTVNLVRQADIVDLQGRWNDLMPSGEIAYLLGIPESAVRELTQGGLWESDRPSYKAVITLLAACRRGVFFSKGEIR